MIGASDWAVLRLRFRGHSTTMFEGRQGRGQPITSIANLIYRMAAACIAATGTSRTI